MTEGRPYNPNVIAKMVAGEYINPGDRAQLKLNLPAPGELYPWEIPPPNTPAPPSEYPERADLRSGIPELQMATNGVGKAVTKVRLRMAVKGAERLQDKVTGREFAAEKIAEPKKGWAGYSKPENPVRPTSYMERRRVSQIERLALKRRENANHMARLAMAQPKPGTKLTWGDSIHKAKVEGAIAAREVRDKYLGARFDWKAGAHIKKVRITHKQAKISRLQQKMH